MHDKNEWIYKKTNTRNPDKYNLQMFFPKPIWAMNNLEVTNLL